MAIEPGETNLDGWLRPQGGSYPCPRAVGSLLVYKGHTLLGLPEAQTQVARVFVGLCALAPAPAPPLLLPGAGLRTPGLGAGGGGGPGERDCAVQGGLRAMFIVPTEAFWDRGSPHPRPGHTFGESFTEQRGRYRGQLCSEVV